MAVRRKLLALFVGGVVCGFAEAGNGFVVGVMANAGILDISSDAYNAQGIEMDLLEEEQGKTSAGIGAKIGYDFYFSEQQAIRGYIDYHFNRFKTGYQEIGNFTIQSYGVNADYRYDFAPMVGVFVGGSLNYNDISNNGRLNYDTSQAGAGINAGFVFTPVSHLEVELRWRYNAIDIADKTFEPTSSQREQGITRRKLEVEEPMYFHLGLNYKF